MNTEEAKEVVSGPRGPFRVEGPHQCTRSANDPEDVHWSLFDNNSGNIAHFDKKEDAESFLKAYNAFPDLIELLKRCAYRIENCIEDIADLRETADWKRTTQDDAFDEGNSSALEAAREAIRKATQI